MKFARPVPNNLELVISDYPEISKNANWHNSIVKYQQANYIVALIEKLTNSIDAILSEKCFESGIKPKSKETYKSISHALKTDEASKIPLL